MPVSPLRLHEACAKLTALLECILGPLSLLLERTYAARSAEQAASRAAVHLSALLVQRAAFANVCEVCALRENALIASNQAVDLFIAWCMTSQEAEEPYRQAVESLDVACAEHAVTVDATPLLRPFDMGVSFVGCRDWDEPVAWIVQELSAIRSAREHLTAIVETVVASSRAETRLEPRETQGTRRIAAGAPADALPVLDKIADEVERAARKIGRPATIDEIAGQAGRTWMATKKRLLALEAHGRMEGGGGQRGAWKVSVDAGST